jgi:oligoendopeptidase F
MSNLQYKTEWDLENLFYKNENDPRIEEDLLTFEKVHLDFEKKYKNTNFIFTPTTLFEALQDYEELLKASAVAKSPYYFYYRKDLNVEDSIAAAFLTKIGNRMTESSNKVVFFELELAKIPVENQKTFLEDENLKPYRYFLSKIFENAKYLLTEKEEQLSSLLSQTSYSLWVEGQKKLESNQTVLFNGKNIPISEASSILPELPKDERDELHKKILEVYKTISHFAEAEINAVYNYKKVMDDRRGFKTPYESTVISNEDTNESVKLLVDLVTRNFEISKRFYRLHAKLLKQDKLSWADRGVKIGKIDKKFDFDVSVQLVRNVFSQISEKYTEVFDRLLKGGRVDVYPRQGKISGAYCSYGYEVPTVILLNHVEEVKAVETLAHEMGHAIHTEFSKSQSVFYQGSTSSTAEVASTFFEQAVSTEMESQFTTEEKVILLHNRILGDITTIFRQVACFNFELEMHEKIRKEGQISKEIMSEILIKHMHAYMGDAFETIPDDGYFFVGWPHIRNFFYVYTYAYGQLVSRALFENWKQDKTYEEKIAEFLSLGTSMSPEDIFKSIGVDTSKPEFFEAGLRSIEKDIDRLEELTSKQTS